jgi:hypothetical protein
MLSAVQQIEAVERRDRSFEAGARRSSGSARESRGTVDDSVGGARLS